MPSATLPDRAVVSLTGEEARAFLDRLVTCDVGPVAPGRAAFGALLSPQGKILADFVLHLEAAAGEPTFLFDTPAASAAELVRRLGLYKLRAKLAIADVTATHRVVAGWGGAARPDGTAATDPRLPELGWRAILPVASEPAPDPSAYDAHRLALGVPDATADGLLGHAFPHEALMEQLGGVDFGKGCYVGQEIVSRMQHRGTARTRLVAVAYEGAGAPPGSEVRAGERVLGRTASVAGDRGLALLRLDRAAEAMAAGGPLLFGGVPARLAKPAWARFPYPGEAAEAA